MFCLDGVEDEEPRQKFYALEFETEHLIDLALSRFESFDDVVFGFGCIGEIVVIIEACSNNAVLDGGCPANRLHGVAGGIVVRRFIDLHEASECRHDAAFEWGLYFEPLAQVGA